MRKFLEDMAKTPAHATMKAAWLKHCREQAAAKFDSAKAAKAKRS
jgi:hypothetical protein